MKLKFGFNGFAVEQVVGFGPLAVGLCCAVCLSGCFASSRHVSLVRPDTVLPDKGLSVKYRLDDLSLVKPTVKSDVDQAEFTARHEEDTQAMLKVVRDSLYKHYPDVFSDTPTAHSLSVGVSWRMRYQGDPIVHSFLTNLIVPDGAEQETIYWVVTKDTTESWSITMSASRMSETWETWGLPVGFIPIPGKSDWPKTFCCMRQGKDSLVSDPSNQMNDIDCIRDLVFEPKVDGDVIAALIMRAVNQHRRSKVLVGLGVLKKDGAK